MSCEKEWIKTEVRWWNTYCKTALLLGQMNDALRLLNIPMNNKEWAEKELGIFLANTGVLGKES